METFVSFCADQNGISNLSESISTEIALFVHNTLKSIILMAKKFKNSGRRSVLTADDLEASISFHGLSSLFSYSLCGNSQFKYIGNVDSDLYVRNDTEVDLNALINTPLPKLPLEPFVKSHWLVIDGVQPSIPENPHSPTLAQQQLNQDIKSNESQTNDNQTNENNSTKSSKKTPMLLNQMAKGIRKTEQVQIKTTTTHALSLEQQILFKEVTEAIMGNDETKRLEALNCLSTDCGLQVLLPRLSITISEGVRCNIAQHNLAILIYLMRMIQSLFHNETVTLERCLHELLPAIMSCILSRQLCAHVQSANHWALREFSARLLSMLTKKYEHLGLRLRISKALSRPLYDSTSSFATLYGAVFTLTQLGTDTTRVIVAPKYNFIMEAIKRVIEDPSTLQPEKNAAEKLRQDMEHVLQ